MDLSGYIEVKIRSFARGVGWVLVLFALFCTWYYVAANYDYSSLAGTYVFNQDKERCTLYLRSDRTFTQELDHSGSYQKSEGTWYRYGESHVSFSSEFLKVPGEELNANGEAHGQFEKTLG